MLSKLLKYDLKYMVKNMSIFYILSLFFSITTRILFNLKQTVFISIVSKISLGIMISLLANILFNTIIRSFVRFNDSIYKDESYLTHTLPVTKTQIYESRFLQALIFSLIGFIFIIISLLITYYTKERWLSLIEYINAFSNSLNINGTIIIFTVIILFFFEIINMIQCGFLGLIIGNRFNNAKIGFSFLFGFIAYMVTQVVNVLILLIASIFNNDLLMIFTSSSLDNLNIIKTLFGLSIIGYILIIFIMNIICVKSLNKGVNV